MNSIPTSHARVLQITSVPLGEAPEWVREKWVGLSLPLAQKDGRPLAILGGGVLSGPTGLLSCLFAAITGRLRPYRGYIVESKVAIELLGATHPEAAAWWKENVPHLLKPKRLFLFDEKCGRVVE